MTLAMTEQATDPFGRQIIERLDLCRQARRFAIQKQRDAEKGALR
jgi:hypothetical protein